MKKKEVLLSFRLTLKFSEHILCKLLFTVPLSRSSLKDETVGVI
jgi:hypothetical protein